MKESLDLLILENDEKDKYVRELELDLKDKSQHTEHLSRGMNMVTVEAQERETKLNQMKLERDMKENEAAAHLAQVEEKAKRVDALEGQIVILQMDKDELKRQVGVLNDQICLNLEGKLSVPMPKRPPNIQSQNNIEYENLDVNTGEDDDDSFLGSMADGPGQADLFVKQMNQINNNPLARSNTTANKFNRLSAPLGGLTGL